MKPGDRVRWDRYEGTLVGTIFVSGHGIDAQVDWDDVPGKPTPWIRSEELKSSDTKGAEK